MAAGGETAAGDFASARPDAARAESDGSPLPPSRHIAQEDSGAVTLEVYPDRVEARGFVDGKRTVRN